MVKDLQLTQIEKKVLQTIYNQDFFIETLDNLIQKLVPSDSNKSLVESLHKTLKYLKGVNKQQRIDHLKLIDKSASITVRYGVVNLKPVLRHEVSQLKMEFLNSNKFSDYVWKTSKKIWEKIDSRRVGGWLWANLNHILQPLMLLVVI